MDLFFSHFYSCWVLTGKMSAEAPLSCHQLSLVFCMLIIQVSARFVFYQTGSSFNPTICKLGRVSKVWGSSVWGKGGKVSESYGEAVSHGLRHVHFAWCRTWSWGPEEAGISLYPTTGQEQCRETVVSQQQGSWNERTWLSGPMTANSSCVFKVFFLNSFPVK